MAEQARVSDKTGHALRRAKEVEDLVDLPVAKEVNWAFDREELEMHVA